VPLAAVESPYHRVHVEAPAPERREITLADGAVPADRDFELAWAPRAHAAPQAAWFTEEKDGRHYGVLMVLPPAAGPAARLAREVVFVLDTSGSMSGASIRQAKEALLLALERLQPEDRFEVIEFNSTAQVLFGEARDATRENVRRAVRWVASLEARGGTEMAAALRLALNGKEETDRVRQVVFLTDGAVGNEEALFRLLRERLGDSRLFTVGIGSAPNSHFMTQAAQLGRGTFTYIGRIEEVGAKMGELFAKLEAPVLKGLEAHWPPGVQVEAWPARLPDLYAGEPVVVAVALDRLQGEVRLAGERDGRHWEAYIPLARNAPARGMGGLWAREKIAALMASLRDGAPEAEVRARVIEVATAHRLVTKYTSFVAVDKTPARPADESLKTAAVPTLLPAGWEYDKVFGELPQGSTGSRFAIVLGVGLLLLGTLLLRRRA
jgi:Ca-activated chloride channel family protein